MTVDVQRTTARRLAHVGAISLLTLVLASFAARAGALPVVSTTSAQEQKFAFDPARDLEAFEKISFSEFAALYPLDAYQSLKGKQIDQAELADLRSRWKADRERVEKEIARINADPTERFVFDLQRSLESKTFYSKLEYTIDRSVDGFVFLVQKPYKEDATRVAKVVRLLGAPLREIQTTFEQRIAKPLGLVRKPEPKLWPIFVLSSESDYVAFAKWDRPAVQLGGRAAFDSRAQMIVTWISQVPEGKAVPAVVTPTLLALANALEHAYYQGLGDRPSSLLVYSGVAGYLSDPPVAPPDASSKRELDPESLDRIVDACSIPSERDLVLFPVEDLIEARDARDVVNLARNRAENLGVPAPDEKRVLQCFRDQATLWAHFFLDGAGGRYREHFNRFLAAAMSGPAALVEFRLEFHEVHLLELNREFYAYLFKEHERLFPDAKLDWNELKTLFADRASTAAKEPAAAPPSKSTLAMPPSTFTPASFAIGPSELDARHGIALVVVRGGDLEGGLAALRELAAASPPPPLDGRVARDIERVEQLIRLRDAYLEHLRASGGTLVTRFQKQSVVAPVDHVADGFVYLGHNPLGLAKVPLSSIEPYEIAKQAGTKEERGDTEAWVRFYPYVLVNESKWEKLLKERSPKGDELRTDAHEWYASTLRAGEVAARIDELARASMPKTAKEGLALFAPIRAIMTEYGDLPIVQKRMDGIRQLATAAALTTYEEKDPRDLVHGTYLSMGDGRVNLVYEFDQAAEGEDFVKDVGYLAEYRSHLEKTQNDEAQSTWKVEGGEFVGSGAACYRHVLGFSAPMTVRYDLRFPKPSGRAAQQSPTFLLGICDNHAGAQLMSANFADLMVNDPPSRYTQSCSNAAQQVKYGKVYTIEIQNDGTTVSTWMNGEKLCELPCKSRTSGELFFWFNCDLRLAVQRLEIQCKIDPAALEARRVAFVRAKLAEMGIK